MNNSIEAKRGVGRSDNPTFRVTNIFWIYHFLFPRVNNSIEASAEALDAATTLRLGSPTSLGRASCLRSILSPLHANLSRDFAPKLCFLAVPSRVYCPVGFLWSEWTFLGQKYPRAVTGPPGSNSIPPVWPGGPFQRFSFFGGTCV